MRHGIAKEGTIVLHLKQSVATLGSGNVFDTEYHK